MFYLIMRSDPLVLMILTEWNVLWFISPDLKIIPIKSVIKGIQIGLMAA